MQRDFTRTRRAKERTISRRTARRSKATALFLIRAFY